ncbi:28 kDa ribonucleoprotein, chloroplastic [Linum perenne]
MATVEEAAASSENLQVSEDDGSAVKTEEEDSKGRIPASPSGAGTLFVGNLPLTVTSEELTEIFAEAGRVSGAEVCYGRETQKSRGFGFVSFETAEDAEAALNTMNGVVSLRVFMHHLLLLCFVPNFHCRIL